MAPQVTVLCLCCNKYLTKKREREHRRKAYNPYQDAQTSDTSRRNVNYFSQRLDSPESEANHSSGAIALPEIQDLEHQGTSAEFGDDLMDVDDTGIPDPVSSPHNSPVNLQREDLLSSWKAPVLRDWDPSDSEDDGTKDDGMEDDDVPGEDGTNDGEIDIVDWDAIERDCGMSAWDKLGEGYEADAAKIEDKLSEYDKTICRAFAYKLTTHTPDTAYKKIPFAFHTDPVLPSLPALRARVTFLSGFKPELYDCCPNSCCCYVGPHSSLKSCPFCGENRYRHDGKTARKKFTYIPIIPRLKAFAQNTRMAEKMQYRNESHSQATPGIVTDVFEGSHYQTLRKNHVKLDGHVLDHKYFDDARDVALGLSTDGFAPFNKRKSTAWPLIVFNYNLPPDIRFHVENILSLGVIPGPKKPHDCDSFLWPFMQEMFRLAQGIRAFDALSSTLFLLHAYLILVFGDIPAVSMIMRIKGHNGFSPCRMCEIKGLRVPETRATTHYVPLDQTPHPDVSENPNRTQNYDPRHLPLRTHRSFLAQASEVDSALTNVAANQLAKTYGIKGTPLLSYLSSLSFPRSFPYDFMHLIWENLVKNLILHWSGDFKGLDDGDESYELPKAIWEGIGKSTAASGSTIPSAYGSRVPNIADDRSACTADMWSFWTLYLGPVLLRKRFSKVKYYRHFVSLVSLLTICLKFEITDDEINIVREGFARWVEEYEDIYYQHDANRLSTCPVTVHALLHIADSIAFMGPVWCYWAFPMERYCNRLKPSIRSRRFPYAAMDRYVLEDAQLNQIKSYYGCSDELSLRTPRKHVPQGAFQDIENYPFNVLLPPRNRNYNMPPGILTSITAALSTRFNIPVTLMRTLLKGAIIEEWGKMRAIDSEEGDTFHSSSLAATTSDRRDATFVRYQMYIDIFANQRRRVPKYVLETFYGQLEHIFLIQLKCDDIRVEPEKPIVLAAVRNCKLERDDPDLSRLDIHLYTRMSSLDFVDITSVQALVGRVKSDVAGGEWAIIDRSGTLARAVCDDNDSNND